MKTISLKTILHPDLLHGSIIKSLICYAAPLWLSLIFYQLYNAVDTVIVGHYLKEESLAAIGASAVLFEIIVNFGNGFGNGLSIVAARAFGSGNEKKLKQIVAASIVIMCVLTLVTTIISLLLLRPLLVLLGTPQQILDESLSYITLIGMFCGILYLYNLCAGMLRAIGNSFTPLIFLIFSSVLNIFLDILLITQFKLGVKGTAIATVIAQGISAFFTMIYLVFKAQILIPHASSFVPGKNEGKIIYKELIGQGLSMSLMGSLVSFGTLILQSAINSFGTMIIASHIASRKLFAFSNIFIFASGMSVSTFVSQNYGANQISRARQGVKIGNLTTIGYALILTALSPLIVKPLITFITGSQNPEILNYGIRYLCFAYPFFTVLGPLIVIRTSLQGFGAKLLPLISSIIELCGKILFTFFIIPVLGITGIIICEPLIWVVMTISLIIAYYKKIRLMTK